MYVAVSGIGVRSVNHGPTVPLFHVNNHSLASKVFTHLKPRRFCTLFFDVLPFTDDASLWSCQNVTPYRFTWTIFILGLALSYRDKLLVFR